MLKIFDTVKMQRRINTLEGKVDVLEDTIKDELYKEFMAKLGEPMEMSRLRNENKNLRKKVKVLKEMLKEGDKKHDKKSKV